MTVTELLQKEISKLKINTVRLEKDLGLSPGYIGHVQWEAHCQVLIYSELQKKYNLNNSELDLMIDKLH